MEIRALTPHTGVEVLGVDLKKAVDKARLNGLLAKHSVVVFRGQKLAPDEYMKAGQIWGEIMPQMLERFTLPDYPLGGFVSAADTDKPRGQRVARAVQYHTDHSNYPAPPKATLLHALTIPSKGGDTQFVNVHA